MILKVIEENGEELLSTLDSDEELDAVYELSLIHILQGRRERRIYILQKDPQHHGPGTDPHQQQCPHNEQHPPYDSAGGLALLCLPVMGCLFRRSALSFMLQCGGTLSLIHISTR